MKLPAKAPRRRQLRPGAAGAALAAPEAASAAKPVADGQGLPHGRAFGEHRLVQQWKKQLREGLPQVFSDRRVKAKQADAEFLALLYRWIGELKVELNWWKKAGLDR